MRDVEASLRGASLLGWAGVGGLELTDVPDAWFAFDAVTPNPACAPAAEHLFRRFVLPEFLPGVPFGLSQSS